MYHWIEWICLADRGPRDRFQPCFVSKITLIFSSRFEVYLRLEGLKVSSVYIPVHKSCQKATSNMYFHKLKHWAMVLGVACLKCVIWCKKMIDCSMLFGTYFVLTQFRRLSRFILAIAFIPTPFHDVTLDHARNEMIFLLRCLKS